MRGDAEPTKSVWQNRPLANCQRNSIVRLCFRKILNGNPQMVAIRSGACCGTATAEERDPSPLPAITVCGPCLHLQTGCVQQGDVVGHAVAEDRGAVVVDQLREKLIKIGAKVVSHGRYVTSSQFRRPALINILWLAGAK
jgi:hypothetical protein